MKKFGFMFVLAIVFSGIIYVLVISWNWHTQPFYIRQRNEITGEWRVGEWTYFDGGGYAVTKSGLDSVQAKRMCDSLLLDKKIRESWK